jgi:hypothetical protein
MAALIAYAQQRGNYNYVLEDPDSRKNRIYIETQGHDVQTLVPKKEDYFFAQTVKATGSTPNPVDNSADWKDNPVVITRGKHGNSWSNARQNWYARIGMLDPWLLSLDYSMPSPSRLQWIPEEKHVFMFYPRAATVTQDIWTGIDMNGSSTYKITTQADYNVNFYQAAYGEFVGFNMEPTTTAITLMRMQPQAPTQSILRTHTNGQMFFVTYDKNSKTGFFVEVAGSTNNYTLVSMEDYSFRVGNDLYTANARTVATFTAPGLKDLIEQFPSNLKYSTDTRKVFYTGHYGAGHTPSPQRIVIDTATNLVTADSCSMLTPAAPSHSYKFDGQDDNITITNNAGLALGTDDFTFEFWFRLDISTVTVDRTIVSMLASGTTFAALRIGLLSGKLRWLISLNGTSHAADWRGAALLVPGTWYHVMFTRQGTTYSIYLNGVLDFTVSFGTSATSLFAGTVHKIGSLDNNTVFFFGVISNMRLIKGQSIVTGTTVGTQAFTPSTSQLTASTLGHTGTGMAASLTGAVTLLTCQDTTLTSNGTLSLTFTAAGAGAGSIAAPAQGINPFNSHGQSAPTWTSGAYVNNGLNTWWLKPHVFRHNGIDYITFCTQDKSCFNFNFERWISPDQRTWSTWSIGQGTNDDQLTYHSKIVWGQNSINAYEMVRSWVPTNEEGTRLAVFQNNKLSTITFDATQGWVQSNIQNHDVRSYGIDVTGRLYIVTRGLASPPKVTSNADIWLGGQGYGAIYTYDPLITSDEVIIEKAQNYQQYVDEVINTSCTVYATSSRPLHFKGDVRAVPTGPFGTSGSSWAADFNATTTVVYGANSADFAFGTGDFTVEFWLYSNVAWSAQSSLAGIVSQRQNDTSNGWFIGQFASAVGGANKMWTRFNSSTWQGNLDFPSTLDVGTQVWEHWALVRKDGIMYWYKNGVACGQVNNTAEINDVGGQFVVGWSETWNRFLNAGISNLRICKGLAVYTGEFTTPTANFSVTQLANPFGGVNTEAISAGQCVFLGFQTNDVTLDAAKLYVEETITLRIQGSNMTFDNEENFKTVTTLATGPITVPLRIVGPGSCYMSYTKN